MTENEVFLKSWPTDPIQHPDLDGRNYAQTHCFLRCQCQKECGRVLVNEWLQIPTGPGSGRSAMVRSCPTSDSQESHIRPPRNTPIREGRVVAAEYRAGTLWRPPKAIFLSRPSGCLPPSAAGWASRGIFRLQLLGLLCLVALAHYLSEANCLASTRRFASLSIGRLDLLFPKRTFARVHGLSRPEPEFHSPGAPAGGWSEIMANTGALPEVETTLLN